MFCFFLNTASERPTILTLIYKTDLVVQCKLHNLHFIHWNNSSAEKKKWLLRTKQAEHEQTISEDKMFYLGVGEVELFLFLWPAYQHKKSQMHAKETDGNIIL